MRLHFVHGWGFDRSIWDELAPLLPRAGKTFAERGYFGGKGEAAPAESAIWITHSLGTLLALKAISSQCRAMIAINGFDRFSSSDDAVGISPRVLDLMLARLAREPRETVLDFRRGCGSVDMVEGGVERLPLEQDLVALRDLDCREEARRLRIPVLSLQGAADPILPLEMRARTLHGIPAAKHNEHLTAGHLLPLEQPRWCAGQITAFLGELP